MPSLGRLAEGETTSLLPIAKRSGSDPRAPPAVPLLFELLWTGFGRQNARGVCHYLPHTYGSRREQHNANTGLRVSPCLHPLLFVVLDAFQAVQPALQSPSTYSSAMATFLLTFFMVSLF